MPWLDFWPLFGRLEKLVSCVLRDEFLVEFR
jgi:hypothetical protein